MASNDTQAAVMIDCHHALKNYYPPEARVYVGFDLMIYYIHGDRRISVAPDVFVALDVVPGSRDTYQVWAEGKPPDFVLEVASPSTARRDARGKKEQYQDIGVPEYWLYDPKGGLHRPRLQGFELRGGRYRQLAENRKPAVDLAVRSNVLGLELHFDGERLRLWDPAVLQYLPSLGEESASWRDAQRQARDEAKARREAERQVRDEANARREAERQVREQANACRDAERQVREQANARRDAERQVRDETKARRDAERQMRNEADARRDAERRLQTAERALAALKGREH